MYASPPNIEKNIRILLPIVNFTTSGGQTGSQLAVDQRSCSGQLTIKVGIYVHLVFGHEYRADDHHVILRVLNSNRSGIFKLC